MNNTIKLTPFVCSPCASAFHSPSHIAVAHKRLQTKKLHCSVCWLLVLLSTVGMTSVGCCQADRHYTHVVMSRFEEILPVNCRLLQHSRALAAAAAALAVAGPKTCNLLVGCHSSNLLQTQVQCSTTSLRICNKGWHSRTTVLLATGSTQALARVQRSLGIER